MKKFIMMAVLAVSIVTGKAQNLLTNGDFDHDNIRHELRTDWVSDTCAVSLFTEDYTWNKCLKLEVKKITEENQVRKVYAKLLLGADGKLAGFSVKPNTVYQVSLELRGTVPGVSLKAALWNKDVESIWDEVEFTGVEPAANVPVTSKWTRIHGSFKTAANTKRAALGISLWGDSSQQSVFSWKTEQYLLVDNVTVKEKKNIEENQPLMNLSEIQAKKIIPLPAQQIGGFNIYGKNQAATAKTYFSISRTENALHLEIDCYSNDTIRASVRDNGTKIWHDDVVEIFFAPSPKKDRLLSQFAVSAGGGRFMGNGVNELLDYGKWQAKSTINDSGWKLVVEIPFAALGFEIEPSPGDLLGFNVCRQDISELSTWSPVRNGFHDPDNFNLILFGEKQDYVKKVLAELGECPKEIDEMRKDFASTQGSIEELYLKGEILRKSINNMKLGKSSYLLSVADLSSDFSFPYNPDHETIILNHEQPIALRSAINEQCPLPLTITNRSGRTASYRVMVHPNLKFNSYEISGLDNNFPGNQIEMFEGIVMKDGDNENSSQRFDALPRMNQSRTITVAAGQTGLIWVNFNCREVKADVYKGAIRVTPLGETAKMENNIEYSGPAKDFPIVLEVLPIVLPMDNPEIPCWLMTSCETEDIYRAQAGLGGRMIAVNPWSFRYTFNEKGEIVSDVIIPELIKRVKTQMEWQTKQAYTGGLKFYVHFSAYGVFERQFLNKKIKIGSPEWENAWKNNLLAIAANFAELGLSDDEWGIEILDEPNGKNLAKDLQVCKIARETLPEIFLSVTWAAANFGHTPDTIRQFIPYLNDHCFWNGHLRDPAYVALAKEIRERGHHYSFYACSTSMRENLYRYFRLHAWKGYEFGAETIGLYIFIDAPHGTAGSTNWKMTPQGGIAYRSDDECITSIRMENFRRGLTDIAYLNVLKNMTAGRKTKAAEKANSFLKQAAKKAVVELIHEPKTADRLRNEAIDHILLLQKE